MGGEVGREKSRVVRGDFFRSFFEGQFRENTITLLVCCMYHTCLSIYTLRMLFVALHPRILFSDIPDSDPSGFDRFFVQRRLGSSGRPLHSPPCISPLSSSPMIVSQRRIRADSLHLLPVRINPLMQSFTCSRASPKWLFSEADFPSGAPGQKWHTLFLRRDRSNMVLYHNVFSFVQFIIRLYQNVS